MFLDLIRVRPKRTTAQNHEKLTPPLYAKKCTHWLDSPSPCPFGHTINPKFFEQKVRMSASEEPYPPCPQNVHTGQLSPPRDVLYGRPLTAQLTAVISE